MSPKQRTIENNAKRDIVKTSPKSCNVLLRFNLLNVSPRQAFKLIELNPNRGFPKEDEETLTIKNGRSFEKS